MEGFTVALALVNAIPVLLFGSSMILVASRFGHPLFIIGAALSTLAGCCKVAWKLILVSFTLGFGSINWSTVVQGLIGFPSVVFSWAGWGL